MSRLYKWHTIPVACHLVVSFLFPCSVSSNQAPFVQVERVQIKKIFTPLEALGTAKALHQITLTPNTTEKVSEVFLRDGEKVTKGTVLVRFNQQEETAQLDFVKASLSEARDSYQRAENLKKSKTISDSVFKERKTDLLEAEFKVAELEARIKDLTLIAPFDGVLGLSDVSVGALLKPGDPITTLSDISFIKVDFDVPDLYISTLEKGQLISGFVMSYPGKKFEGKLQNIDSNIDASTRTVTVRALIPNPFESLKPGMLMNLIIQTQLRDSMLISEKSVVLEGGNSYVFTVDPLSKMIKKNLVQTGIRQDGCIEVFNLDTDQLIISEGHFKVREGAKVQITEE